VTVEDHWPEGGIGEAVLSAFADAEERPRVSILAVRDIPTSGKPTELLAAAGIDAEHIVQAARELVSSSGAGGPGVPLEPLLTDLERRP
jgi:transketolase